MRARRGDAAQQRGKIAVAVRYRGMDLWRWMTRTGSGDAAFAAEPTGVAPGKQSVTELLPPRRAVQRRAPATASPATAAPLEDPFFFAAEPGAIAATGVAGAGRALPYATELQRAFGRHALDDVRAHVGGAAATAAQALGADAYACGTDVAFAAEPDLHLVAHEAAHVVQQRGGVALHGGLGQAGDRYEQHADRVADAVVRGESVEGLLDELPRGGGATTGVQRQQRPGAGPTAPTTPAAQLAARLNALAGPADVAASQRFIDDLRALAPVTVPADARALQTAVDAHLAGDARWRATNLIQHGPEARWPPELRRNNVAIGAAARTAARAGRPPAEVADLLRPLNVTAQQQILRSWGSEGRGWSAAQRPIDPTTQRPMELGRYLEEIRAALGGPSFAPAETTGTAPILDLDLRIPPGDPQRGHADPAQEAAVYEYFRAVYAARGFEFVETPAHARSPSINVCNIRRFDLTRTAAVHAPRTGVRDMNGQLFRIWRDGDGVVHVRRHEWSTTGPGGRKQADVAAHRNTLLPAAGLPDAVTQRRGTAATTQPTASDAVHEAETAVAEAGRDAEAAFASSASRGNATTTLAQAEAAMTAARRAHRLAADAPEVGLHPNARGRRPRSDPAHQARATQLQRDAAAAFARARDAWVIARYQDLSNREEAAFAQLRAARATLAALPPEATTRPQAEAAVATAQHAYAAARTANNRGANGDNQGAMSENNGVAWLQEGQYRAERRRVGDAWRYAVNGGGSGQHDLSGYAPVDRDWNANGVIDPGERDIPATAIGSGVQIHQGGNPTASIGCQVSPDFGDLDGTVQQSSDHAGFAYVLVEAEHLPAWTGPAAPGATGAAATSGASGATSGASGATSGASGATSGASGATSGASGVSCGTTGATPRPSIDAGAAHDASGIDGGIDAQ